ncbi:MAG: hypothetical protein IAF02_22465 [Anaerolineae bacterium]|nr:hypothetical protein [Anaerolineae bacterium]
MINPSISLICGTCSHDWIQDLGQINTFKVINRDGQLTKIYRVPCPICDNILMIESSTDTDDTPSAWGT